MSDAALTGLSPDGQVFILLDVQHELQSVAHASLGGDEGRAAIFARIECVALPIASKDLRDRGGNFFFTLHNLNCKKNKSQPFH